jgi:hypothetical protein
MKGKNIFCFITEMGTHFLVLLLNGENIFFIAFVAERREYFFFLYCKREKIFLFKLIRAIKAKKYSFI